jgi:hypothetical protein
VLGGQTAAAPARRGGLAVSSSSCSSPYEDSNRLLHTVSANLRDLSRRDRAKHEAVNRPSDLTAVPQDPWISGLDHLNAGIADGRINREKRSAQAV